jgi:Ran GTPase-activating protein (RanGAP) involved in mRNA processing and transport
MAPGLAAASHLEKLHLLCNNIGNDGVSNLVPECQANRSLTILDLRYNNIQGTVGIENAVALAARCTTSIVLM